MVAQFDAEKSPSPLTDNMRRLTASVVTALQDCEREILRLEQEAQVRADEIIADARQKAQRMEAALVKFDGRIKSQFSGWAEKLERKISEELGDGTTSPIPSLRATGELEIDCAPRCR
jgi:cell division septum initiation protein DivIVA